MEKDGAGSRRADTRKHARDLRRTGKGGALLVMRRVAALVVSEVDRGQAQRAKV
jgi:hypothetical protein